MKLLDLDVVFSVFTIKKMQAIASNTNGRGITKLPDFFPVNMIHTIPPSTIELTFFYSPKQQTLFAFTGAISI